MQKISKVADMLRQVRMMDEHLGREVKDTKMCAQRRQRPESACGIWGR